MIKSIPTQAPVSLRNFLAGKASTCLGADRNELLKYISKGLLAFQWYERLQAFTPLIESFKKFEFDTFAAFYIFVI